MATKNKKVQSSNSNATVKKTAVRPLKNVGISKQNDNFKDNQRSRPVASGKIMERVPDEVFLKIFGYLDGGDLLAASMVCKQWLTLANDNLLWQGLYTKYLMKTKIGKDLGIPLEPPHGFWKSSCIKKSVENRNHKVFTKTHQLDAYTNLAAKISDQIQKLGVIFTLAFQDGRGTLHYVKHNSCFYNRMSITASWYNFNNLPEVSRMKTVKLLSLNPVFYTQNGNACKNGPFQRSLLREFAFNLKSSNKLSSSDDNIDFFKLENGFLVATWKNGGGLAFIMANLHCNQLIERCLQGTFYEPYKMISVKHLREPIHGQRDLHNCNMTLELRTQQTTIWGQCFRDVFSRGYSEQENFYVLNMVNPMKLNEHSPLDRPLELLWKSENFQRKTQDLCILDVILTDGSSRCLWYVSDFVLITRQPTTHFSYDYDAEEHFIMYEDDYGNAELHIKKAKEEERTFMTSINIKLTKNC